jgi:hypothetical protein
MAAKTASRSKRGTRTSVPASSIDTVRQQVSPYAWNSGSTASVTSRPSCTSGSQSRFW